MIASVATTSPTPLRYAGGMLAGTLVAAGVIAGAVAVSGQPLWWRGFAAAGVAALASLLASFAVVLPAFRAELSTLAYTFLVAGAIRAAVLAAFLVVAIKYGGHPANATLAIGGLFYLAIVAIEGRLLWPSSPNPNSITRNRA